MPPAARVYDPTTHGGFLSPGPGSRNVMIGGLPAWLATVDQHACPAVSASGADGVGSVLMGSLTVRINGQMACRQGDLVVEKPGLAIGPVDPIAVGCPTVLIGVPSLVRNPDGSFSIGNITITGYSDTDALRVLRDLATMAATPDGLALINRLANSPHTMTIRPQVPPPNPPNAGAGPTNWPDATPAGQPVFDGAGNPLPGLIGTGRGSNVDLGYNPEQWPNTGSPQTPGDAVLFHEMTHGDHQENGTNDCRPRPDNFDTNEEFNTIGPENQYRSERGLPPRRDHHDLP